MSRLPELHFFLCDIIQCFIVSGFIFHAAAYILPFGLIYCFILEYVVSRNIGYLKYTSLYFITCQYLEKPLVSESFLKNEVRLGG